MTLSQRTTPRPATTPPGAINVAADRAGARRRARLIGPGARPLASPGQIAVIYRWATWALSLGLIASGASATYGAGWARRGDVYLLLGLTLAVNVLLTLALRPYIRLMRRFPVILVLDVVFCLAVYADSNIWTSPFQFYSYAALMLPVTIFFYGGALAGSLLFLALDVILLYHGGYTLARAASGGYADTYLMQLAIVPLLAFVFAYPNRLYAQLRRAQQRLDQVEREQLLTTERTRIAQSLHDSVAQMLFGIGMLAESALVRLAGLGGLGATPMHAAAPSEATEATTADTEERAALAGTLGQVRDLASRGNQEMRRAIYALHEPISARRGLATALRVLLAESAARTGLATHLAIISADAQSAAQAPGAAVGATTEEAAGTADQAGTNGTDMAPSSEGSDDPGAILPAAETPDELAALPEAVGEALYRVAREALANVEKHALAFNVWVEVRMRSAATIPGGRQVELVELVVRDDGQGFRRALLSPLGVPEEDEDGLMHFGTNNMRRDMEAVKGKIEITSTPGRGTTVRATAPIG